MKKITFDNNKNIISSKLKILRVKNGLTQEQLAAKVQVLGGNLDQQMISKIERNARIVTDYELVLLSSALLTTPEQLLSDFDGLIHPIEP